MNTFITIRITKNCIFLLMLSLLQWSCSQEKKELKKADANVLTLEKPLTFNFVDYKPEPPRDIPGMNSVSPSGNVMNVNSNYLTINDTPWIPSYGEFNYQRYPEEYWEDAILKMKSQGFTGISSYVFWIGHEEVEGQWDFSGNKNIRKFIELCKTHNMKFFARIGPWVNGEIRNGGHPDWLVERLGDPKNPYGYNGSGGRLRSMDSEYLAAVDKLYEKLAEQMKGMYWKDGGPIFAIQLDNEYTPAHSGIGGTKLIEWEKETALKHGMKVALYTTTGWNKAEFIQDHTIQVHGSYADYYWSRANDFYRVPSYSFSTLRAVDGIDTEVNHFDSTSSTDIDKYITNPYLTCETGIGMHIAYHRRPNINHLDNGAVSLVELGSGCNGMGYFMAIGGNTPHGKNEIFWNRDMAQTQMDMPVFSNDYQTAIGEFGQIRKSYHEYPIQLNFMTDFGQYLAPCQTFIPKEIDELRGVDLTISKEIQRTVRTDGEKGFVFVNNHVKNDTVYQFNNVQFDIKLKDETLKIPEKAINVPVDSYFYWPFNLTLSGATIKYATAQPVLSLKESNTYVFFQNDEITSEFVFDNANIANVNVNNAQVTESDKTTKVTVTKSGLNCHIDVKLKDQSTVRFLVLNQSQAKQLYKNDDKLYLSNAEVILFNHKELKIISEQTKNSVWVYPANSIQNVSTIKEGLFDKFEVNFEAAKIPFTYNETQNGKELTVTYEALNNKGNGHMGVPTNDTFNKGTIVSMQFPEGIPSELYDVRVEVNYKASALRFYKNDVFAYDNYYNGNAWVLSAKHMLSDYTKDMKLDLKFIPLQPKDRIYIAGKYWPDLNKTENVLEVKSIKAIPVYTTSFKTN
ncbi:beta-galactosidase [uncultured Maribacter sp.]|uniref:beta-galactosidase n=1 Tax=uncultured Maribacter sp. TaxID=431308 RepID=UPI002615D1C7|nr:beta-galactosidase [uncultured Maribacter sp.]